MSRLLEINRRIRSIRSLAKVTRAMELVTHTKIGRARKGALSARAYHESFARVISAIQSAPEDDEDEAPGVHASETGEDAAPLGDAHQVVAFLSQKGFCGAFNDRLLAHLAHELPLLGDTRLSVVGRLPPKWNVFMRAAPDAVIAAPDKTWQNDLAALAKTLASRVRRANKVRRAGGKSAHIYFAYNRFQSILEQIPVIEQIWPPVCGQETAGEFQNALIEPGRDALLDEAVAPWIEASLARAWWESAAGENYARLISMKSANENAAIILDTLTLQHNKTRQLVITQELSEITSAFNVLGILKGKREQSEV